MIDNKALSKIQRYFNGKPMIIEGCNGSLGLSFLNNFSSFKIKPNPLILTSYKSNIDTGWKKLSTNIIHLKASNINFISSRKKILQKYKNINVIYCAGYGRPNLFMKNPEAVLDANIHNLIPYKFLNIKSFAYISSSEIYSGIKGEAFETSLLPTSPQHPRGIYIEAKRLGESIIENILSKNIKRYASYRVALAFPPKLLKDDNRVLSDLIKNGKKFNRVTLNGGGDFKRQYQYGPNCTIKILSSIVNGKSTLYNNSGNHIIKLKDLATMVGSILGVKVVIKKKLKDKSAPKTVLINSDLLNKESKYFLSKQNSLKFYIEEMINN